MYQVNIYGIKNIHNKSDDVILREYARKHYKKARDSLKKYPTYEIMGDVENKEYQEIKEKEKNGDTMAMYTTKRTEFFYTHLVKVEKALLETINSLISQITYKPQKKLLKQLKNELLVGRESYFSHGLISDVINDVLYLNENDLFQDDLTELEANEENAQFHCEYIIRQFKRIVNVICKVIKENDLETKLYN